MDTDQESNFRTTSSRECFFMARNQFSGPVTFFRDKRFPVKATSAGYGALIDYFDLKVPLPRILFAIGDRDRNIKEQGWHIVTPRHSPSSDIQGHLKFAIKYEGLDLAVLTRLFQATGPKPIEEMVRAKPTGSYSRRIWQTSKKTRRILHPLNQGGVSRLLSPWLSMYCLRTDNRSSPAETIQFSRDQSTGFQLYHLPEGRGLTAQMIN